ncbi:hypothetical protein N9N07_04320 [Pseudomonadales bacterium]|nr:hypothetical protein [Pseudomonadales bacterium]MDA8790124.1 hypothetical protein [Pseudomonadales bacterium]MDB4421245.1 hypothetical protein [Pseudomonadales bacterium]MDB4451040.1 hypothetical protein [Pseudomonadales bacterium]MDB4528851.1 hypothetical protein [Pseudomonadales bacterium]
MKSFFSSRMSIKRLADYLLVCASAFLLSNPAAASRDGMNTPIDQRAWIDFWEKATNTRYPKYDENYIAGQTIFKGQGKYEYYQYCLAKEPTEDRVELTRKNLKSFRGLTVTEFVSVLYDCANPDELVLNNLRKEDAGLVVYYLHKKYHLRLRQERQVNHSDRSQSDNLTKE